MPRVIISSGHTAASPGVTANGLQEYDLAHKIAKYALKYIRLNGIISLSVPPNMELKERIDWINRTGYMRETNDIAIEIHINDGDKSGLEAWFEGDGGNPSQGVAVQVLDAVSRESSLPNLGAKSEFQHQLGSIAFVHELNPHSIILECGYIDNEHDAAILKQEHNLEACGRGIAKGILNYYGLEYREMAPQYNPSGVMPAPAATPQPAVQPATYQAPAAQPAPVSYQPAAVPATPAPEAKAPEQGFDEEYTDYDEDYYDDNLIKRPAAPVTPVTPAPNAAQNLNTGVTMAAPPSPASSQSKLQNYSAAVPGTPAAPVYNTAPGYPGNYGAPAYPGSYGAPANPTGAGFPSREERKQMISNNYEKVLGREPNQNDLNYFLNVGIREDELLKKMIDSQEHADLVKARQEVITMKKEFNDAQEELQQLRTLKEDQKTIMDEMNQSIEQKNTALTKLQYDIRELQQKQQEQIELRKKSATKKKYKMSFADKLFKAFSDILE